MTIAADLAAFATNTTYDDLPPLAIKYAKVIVASTVASAAMGCDIGSANAFRAMARERGGTPQASIWFDNGPNLPVMDAGRTNAMMCDAAASDDTDLSGSGHVGNVTSTSAIAMAEREHASGRAVIEGIAIGYEIANRIGRRSRSSEVGFHAGVMTIFGATVAAAKVARLSTEQMTHAISLAATSIGGNGVAANTSWAREYDAGIASTLAFTAVSAAANGFTSETRVFEMPRGYFDVFRGHDLETIGQDFGKTWGIVEDLAIKLMPGTWAYQSLAEAAATAAAEGKVTPDQVAKISVSGRAFGGGHMVYRPTDLIGVAHSLPYMLAGAIVDGGYSWGHAEPAKYMDPVIGRLQDLVVGEDEASPYAKRGGGSVTITTTDGRVYSSTMEAPKGSGPRGIEWSDIDYKYHSLFPLSHLATDRMEASLDVIHGLEDAKDVAELTSLLHP